MRAANLIASIFAFLLIAQTVFAAECIDSTALASYITQWKTNSTAFSMPSLMLKIADWKSGAGCTVGMCSGISQYGITWTFDKAYQCGQFVTGDWWVIGPVTVNSVSPAPIGSGESYRNGSMVNPDMALAAWPPQTTFHGYDGRANGYNAAYSQTFPLALNPATGIKSLISTESILSFPFDSLAELDPFPSEWGGGRVMQGSNQKYLKNAAVLTVVATSPPSNSFRPPFVGTAKPIFTAANLRTGLLPSLELTPSVPNLDKLARAVKRPWITIQKRNWMSSEITPVNNEVNYGREVAGLLGDAALVLCSNYSLEQKSRFFTR